MKVLIVDDEELICEIYRDRLTTLGFEVNFCCTLQKGEECLRQNRYDILILDYLMPGGTGLELLQKLKELTENPPKIFLSTGHDNLQLNELSKLGIEEIFYKPFDFEHVIATINKTISKL